MKLSGIKTGSTAVANRIRCPEGEFWVPKSVCSEIRYNTNTELLTLHVDDWWWEKQEKNLPYPDPDSPPRSNFTINL